VVPGVINPENLIATPCTLPVEFRAHLPDSRIAGLGDNSELRASDVASRILKLRMVKDIEKFDA
jgi:hypothetical protein